MSPAPSPSPGGLRVAIVGAGVSGIAMAVRLDRAGLHDLTVYEASDGPGGTWRDNTYPGCEVDVASHAYSFSFFPYDWSRKYAGQEELLRYCEDAVDHFGLRSRCRFGTRVTAADWDAGAGGYRLALGDGTTATCDVLISCVGLLNRPRVPEWPGLESFAGPAFHTARWEHQHDLRGKRVAVVGTGSTAAQVVPALAPVAGELFVFQRQPGWCYPKENVVWSPAQRARFRRFPVLQRIGRAREFHARQNRRRLRGIHLADTPEQHALRAELQAWIAQELPDPTVRAAVTPDYPVGCKRGVITSEFYPALRRPNVELVPHAVQRVTPTSVVDAAGASREVDVLILATGFRPTRFLDTLPVRGPDGQTLHERWGSSASAFLGITVPGFPNLFLLYGPNTNGGVSIMANAERQADAVVWALRRAVRRGGVVDTDPRAMRRFVAWCDRNNLRRRTSAQPEHCTNYYWAEDGRNVTQWPSTTRIYWLMTKTVWRMGIRIRPRPGTGDRRPRPWRRAGGGGRPSAGQRAV
jgi:cation diffusion facilitator CzcD-associated flavoprotein CzcO